MTDMLPLSGAIQELGDAYARMQTRHAVVRAGEREPIPALTRALVYKRDGQTCVFCPRGVDLQPDHIVPWSAGGCDCPTNLRTLCPTCNEDRSNFPSHDDHLRRPVTKACDDCRRANRMRRRVYGEDSYLDDEFGEGDRETVIAFCGACGVMSRTNVETTIRCGEHQ